MDCRQDPPCLSAELALRSRIVDGRYVPGLKGRTNLRGLKTDDLIERSSHLQRLFAEDPSSWRFCKRHNLGFHDPLVDGFRARYSKELLLVDSRTDSPLRCFLEHLRDSLPPPSESLKDRVRVLATKVADAFGVGDHDAIAESLERRRQELQLEPPADLPIGELMGGAFSGHQREGAGICRHRAILLKYACDALGLAQCALLTGVLLPPGTQDVELARTEMDVDHMWNIVRVDGESFFVDGMNFPGELYTAADLVSLRPLEYLRIGGRAGVLSLDPEASVSRRSVAAS